eukprot:4747168-Alexandrium_andersonii.AAC.1
MLELSGLRCALIVALRSVLPANKVGNGARKLLGLKVLVHCCARRVADQGCVPPVAPSAPRPRHQLLAEGRACIRPPPPWHFVYAGTKGDMERQWVCYRLKNYYESTLLCPWCMAINNASILS